MTLYLHFGSFLNKSLIVWSLIDNDLGFGSGDIKMLIGILIIVFCRWFFFGIWRMFSCCYSKVIIPEFEVPRHLFRKVIFGFRFWKFSCIFLVVCFLLLVYLQRGRGLEMLPVKNFKQDKLPTFIFFRFFLIISIFFTMLVIRVLLCSFSLAVLMWKV